MGERVIRRKKLTLSKRVKDEKKPKSFQRNLFRLTTLQNGNGQLEYPKQEWEETMARKKAAEKSKMGRPLRFSEKLDHNGLHPTQNIWIKKVLDDITGLYRTDVIRAAVWCLMKEQGEEVPENWDQQLKLLEIV